MRVIRIGRDTSNDYVIDHPTVSSYHADLYIFDNGAMQIVEHSTNGTYINQSFIHNNTYILLGDELLTVPGQHAVYVSKILGVEVKADTKKPEDKILVDTSKESHTLNKVPGMDFFETLSHYFSNYTNFSGRARRQEYWYICVWNLLFGIIPIVNTIWAMITIIPGLSLTVRRLHDIGKSGWWLFLSFIPVIGVIVIFIWTITDSVPYANEYGTSPKYM